MTIPLTWNTYVQQIATMMVVQTTTTNGVVVGVDPDTNTVMPQALQYAELRVQRDLDLLSARTSRSYTLTAGSNQLVLSASDFVAVETMMVNNGINTTPVLPSSLEFIQNVYGDASSTGVPAYFAMYGGDLSSGGSTSNYIQYGPYSPSAYSATITGMVRLASLYSFATSALAGTGVTWMSSYVPDLLIQASMIYISEFQRNFSAVSNDPQMPGIYEQQYEALLGGAKAENSRSKFEASAWSSKSVPANATATR